MTKKKRTKKSQYTRIEYQCNACGKKRTLVVPPALLKEVGTEGLSTYVDVHSCIKGPEAVQLFVDSDLNVRSQVLVSKQAKENDSLSILGLNIPSPKKTDFITVDVASKSFTPFNLYSLKIRDKLRQANYIIKGDQKPSEKELIVYTKFSRLNFIELNAEVSKKLNRTIVENWLGQLSNSLESLVILDEEIMRYIGNFLDLHLSKNPSVQDLLELDLLLSSTITIPYSNNNTITIYKKEWRDLFPTLPITTHTIYKKTIELCNENKDKKLITIYEQVYEEISQDINYSQFLSAVASLIMRGLVMIEKMKFVTTLDPKLK